MHTIEATFLRKKLAGDGPAFLTWEALLADKLTARRLDLPALRANFTPGGGALPLERLPLYLHHGDGASPFTRTADKINHQNHYCDDALCCISAITNTASWNLGQRYVEHSCSRMKNKLNFDNVKPPPNFHLKLARQKLELNFPKFQIEKHFMQGVLIQCLIVCQKIK